MRDMKIENLTPHTVRILDEDEEVIKEIEPSGQVARVEKKTLHVGDLNGEIPVTKSVFGQVENMPEGDHETLFVVSRVVANALPRRHDLLVPSQLVRDENGQVKGAKSLELVNG